MGIKEQAIAATFRLEARYDVPTVSREDIRDVLAIIDAFGKALNYLKDRVDALDTTTPA